MLKQLKNVIPQKASRAWIVFSANVEDMSLSIYICNARNYWTSWILQNSSILRLIAQYSPSPSAVVVGVSHRQESRSRENLEKKLLIFFSLDLGNCIFISLSLLDVQDFETKTLFLFLICEIFKTVLFLFSIFKIVKKKFSFYSRFMRLSS